MKFAIILAFALFNLWFYLYVAYARNRAVRQRAMLTRRAVVSVEEDSKADLLGRQKRTPPCA